MTCAATITRVHHVGDTGALVLAGWRAFCPVCGYLGPKRENYGTAGADRGNHNRESREAA